MKLYTDFPTETLKTKIGSLETTVKNLQDEIEQLKGLNTNEGGTGE